MKDHYDYIIVGAGAAGCILANRLTASGRHSVLLLEAGHEGRSIWISIPAGFGKLITDPRYNWLFQTEPEAMTRQRKIAVPRGKGLGGSTLINGMIYVRGQPADYDRWASLGADGWGWADVAPQFRKLECYPKGDGSRGHDGPMHVHEVTERYVLSEALLAAAQEAGHALNPDYNGPVQDGFGYYQVLQHRGRRWSVIDGYLKPARARPNLHVLANAQVLKVDLEGGRCVGVTYRRGPHTHRVRAGTEVIMAAGAIQTPQILELSGIGRPDVLRNAGIAVQHAMPGLGENYIDHYCARMDWRVKGALSVNQQRYGWRLALAVAEYFTRRTGILTLGTGLAGGFVKSRPDLPSADVQYFFMNASYANQVARELERPPGMTLAISQMRPESRGSIHIRSANPDEQPAICPNYLASEADQDSLIGGMQVARQIISQPAMARYVDHEKNPGPDVQAREQWLDYVRQVGQTIYHPIGTCRMGTDAAAVVDPRLRMRGLPGLRVADASVMPAMISGNIQGAVMMVAEKASEMILEDAREAG